MIFLFGTRLSCRAEDRHATCVVSTSSCRRCRRCLRWRPTRNSAGSGCNQLSQLMEKPGFVHNSQVFFMNECCFMLFSPVLKTWMVGTKNVFSSITASSFFPYEGLLMIVVSSHFLKNHVLNVIQSFWCKSSKTFHSYHFQRGSLAKMTKCYYSLIN